MCLLHFNELPLRHLFCKLDGVTSGPRSFTGIIGKCLIGCEDLPVVNFNSIQSDVPILNVEEVQELSTDQKYLFEICRLLKFHMIQKLQFSILNLNLNYFNKGTLKLENVLDHFSHDLPEH